MNNFLEDQNDYINHFEIEGIDVEIAGHNDTSFVGAGWEFLWSFKDATEWKRTVRCGPFKTMEDALTDVTEHIRIYGPYKDIKIYTSFFDRIDYLKKYNYINLISIAGKTPSDFTGRKYLDLAPKYSWWKEWRENNLSEDWYVHKYYETILDKLDPIKVRKDLSDRAVLLCYEKPGEFCHRKIVADWFKKRLGITVEEI